MCGQSVDASAADSGGSKLEELGDELSRRGLRTTLAADETGQAVLEVISPRVRGVGGRRLRWHDGGFEWLWGERIGPSPADVSAAADVVARTFQWSPFQPALPPVDR